MIPPLEERAAKNAKIMKIKAEGNKNVRERVIH